MKRSPEKEFPKTEKLPSSSSSACESDSPRATEASSKNADNSKSIQVEIVQTQSLKNLDDDLDFVSPTTEASWPLPMLVSHHNQRSPRRRPRSTSRHRRGRSRSSSRGRQKQQQHSPMVTSQIHPLISWKIGIFARVSETSMDNDRNVYMRGVSRLCTYKDEFSFDCYVYDD